MRPRDDRGSIAPMVPILALAFLILGGLVVDGGRLLNARGQAQAYAEEAARAGATAVDFTQSTLVLKTSGDDNFKTRARRYCEAMMKNDPTVKTCTVDPTLTDAQTCAASGQTGEAPIVVHTHVTVHIETTLMKLVGITGLDASGDAMARPYEGTSAQDAC